MINQFAKISCTGCSACANICPKNCIKMQAEKDGFLYPIIDETNCNKCGLCKKVCPYLNDFKDESKWQPRVKAAWSLNDSIRFNSTSGGIFSELAMNFINNGGYVVGARYTDEFLVEHYLINTVADIALLRQSKYVQSDKKDIFKKIRGLLIKGENVLFVGSPCEVAGLYLFLNNKYEKLITVDFICHGTNSPTAYLKFLNMLEEKYDSKVKKVWFKNKTYGWNRFSTKVEFQNGQIYIKDRYADYFMRGYIGKNKFYIRPSCTKCHYKTLPRIADLTLADFWGIANKNKKLDSDKGTSLVMINSNKGLKIFEKIKNRIYSCDCVLDDAIPGNYAIFNSVKLDERREAFFDDMNKMSFDKLIEKYCPINYKENFIRNFKNLFNFITRKFICK